MMTLLAIVLFAFYVLFVAFTLREVGQGKFIFVLVYLVSFLPVYIVFISFIYAHTESVALTRFIQYSKELVLLYAMAVWWLGQRKTPLTGQWQLSSLDWLFALFGGLAFLYLILPLGEATFVAKATYFKNILLMFLVYFFGRNVKVTFPQWKMVFNVIFVMVGMAFLVGLGEKTLGFHFHGMAGYSKYYWEMLNIEPTGNYGLNWTFEAQGGQPRYGAFFANPLELSASMLIAASLATAHFLWAPFKENQYKYLLLLLASVACVFFAYSRATFVSFFFAFIFASFLLKYYSILKVVFGFGVAVTIYILFFAVDDVRFFVEDTLLFQNSSSLTHLADWLEGINSMIENPMGIGLAMSGNAGGVDDSLRVGGENQFLVYGVQLGVIGMLLYIGILFQSIRHCWKTVRRAQSREEQLVPFVAATVKFGLLLPMITANAEIYLYVSLVSWWMVGYSETLYMQHRRTRVKPAYAVSSQPTGALNQ